METQQAAHGAGGSGPVTDVGQDEALVREFAQAVLEGAAPEELLLFDETVADYRRDPDAVLVPTLSTGFTDKFLLDGEEPPGCRQGPRAVFVRPPERCASRSVAR